MTEREFLERSERALRAIEDALERSGIDLDVERSGPVLTLDFDAAGKIIINQQAAAQEIWVAAKKGGFHYRWQDGRWFDSRGGEELFSALSRLVSAQSGQAVVLGAPAAP